MGSIRMGDIYYFVVVGEYISGITDAKMELNGNEFEMDVYEDEFSLVSKIYSYDSVMDFNDAIAGNYHLEITADSNKSEYSFTVNSIQENWHPEVPVLEPVPGIIPQQYDFFWSWEGEAEFKFVEYGIDEEDFFVEYMYGKDTSGFDDKSFAADFQDNTGMGEFWIFYGDETFEFISDWTHVSGLDLFNGGESLFQFLGYEDQVSFQVIPEPGSVMTMIFVSLLMIARRKKLIN